MKTPHFDRIIFHKFDPKTPAPGGIDTCIRGILKYHRADEKIGIVGVWGNEVLTNRHVLGKWSEISISGRTIGYFPVTELDPGNQLRKIPHSLRIGVAAIRFRRRIGSHGVVQAHRADLGALSLLLWPRSGHTYFIHTQESGILGENSDSFWRKAAVVHRLIEKFTVKHADQVRVFNPDYIAAVEKWNANAKSSPTWWDPEIVGQAEERSPKRNILWVGRFERPKDPHLALATLETLVQQHPEEQWHLTMVGAGNLHSQILADIEHRGLQRHVVCTGRLAPADVMREMSRADIFLMTSVPGYEGYPRVLVEALANGLLSVVTPGADTGKLVADGVNGYTAGGRSPSELSKLIREVQQLSSSQATGSVMHLSAPAVISDLYQDTLI
ncbi:glycosyltransferase [Rhodococcoides fascians A25f]|uniref:glycosyltransferase family 4 protein n=1 Tax=Rhodococcoides fascians TaxID=1828 RepID=UPI0013FDB324|nr:glycosyltransferase [Rhodococcus fascians]QII08117.1 glycosyltransferase [Rhodococcus fascians A25f]